MRVTTSLAVACGAVLAIAPPALGQEQKLERARTEGHLAKPAKKSFDQSLLAMLETVDGFAVNVFASGLGKPRMMTVGADGTVYVTRPSSGDVVALRDKDGDGRADDTRTVVSNLEDVHGLTIHDNKLYLVTIKEVYAAELRRDGSVGTPKRLVDDLGDGGQHQNRTIAFGPDGALYISVGSTCNACNEPNEEHATILKARADGSNRAVFARGLRNTIGFGWHPGTKEMWGMDHGSDWRGDDTPPEELNRLQEGADYGWPFCYGDRKIDELTASEPEGMTKAEHCAKTVGPALTYQAHSAPIAMVFYTGASFPAEYRDDAFVAMRGSWNRKEPVGYKVVRVDFENGKPARFTDFLTGFLLDGGSAHFARPVGLAVAADGALLLSEDANGVIYRIARAAGR